MKYYKGIAQVKISESNLGQIDKQSLFFLDRKDSKEYFVEIYGDVLYLYDENKNQTYFYNETYNIYQAIFSQKFDDILKIVRLCKKKKNSGLLSKNDVIIKARVKDELGTICLYDIRKNKSIEEVGNFMSKKNLRHIFNFPYASCMVNVYVNNMRVMSKIL